MAIRRADINNRCARNKGEPGPIDEDYWTGWRDMTRKQHPCNGSWLI
ncbi:MAG: hypothetical protein ACHQD7_06515 [Chitinophagales bacterium]